jgi:GH25 family lysozyme M1 (1,4-beta-N-acetylmuramidase)
VIDIEHPDGNHGGGAAAPATMPADLATFCQTVEAAIGHGLMVYTGGWWWRPFFAKYQAQLPGYGARPLWLSGFTTSAPKPPAPWTARAIWQFTDKGKVGGITGGVDLDRAQSIAGVRIP